MESSFSLQLVDLLVYLMPGALLLGTVLFVFLPEVFKKDHQHHPWIRLSSFLALAHFLGVMLLMASKSVLYVYEWLTGKPLISQVINSFPDLGLVKNSVSSRVGVNVTDPVHCYRYADTLLVHYSGQNAMQAERLFCLGLLCRNLLLALPLSGLMFLRKSLTASRRRWRNLALKSVLLIALSVVVYKGFVSYTTASVWRTLRGYLAVVETIERP